MDPPAHVYVLIVSMQGHVCRQQPAYVVDAHGEGCACRLWACSMAASAACRYAHAACMHLRCEVRATKHALGGAN